jgi:cytochrome c oxidase subunit II
MDKLEIRIITWAGVVMTLFLVSLLYAVNQKKIEVVSCVPYNATFKKPELRKIDSDSYELFILARMWNFAPGPITIPVGSEMDIYLSSQDVVHGFHIEKKGINMMAIPGAINKITTRFDKPGTYSIVCHEYCGVGHENMSTDIIVTEKKLTDRSVAK